MAISDALVICPETVAVHYSRRGQERVWRAEVSNGSSEGPAEALALHRQFVADTSHNSSAEQVVLRIMPVRPGVSPVELAPPAAQRLVDYLQRFCQQDDGVFQLRAVFSASSEHFVQIGVVFPGTVSASSTADIELSSLPIEQFECLATSDAVTLKRAIQDRTRFPADRIILTVGGRRLHDAFPIARIAARCDAAGLPIQAHIAVGGAYVFLRREGQGHRIPSGPCILTLQLPPRVHGAHVRLLPFDPAQCVSELRWAIQAVSGLPPAGMQLALIAPVAASLRKATDDESLSSLGFTDGCVLQVSTSFSCTSSVEKCLDLPLDVPAAGPAESLYELAAAALGVADASRLALFVGNVLVDRGVDSCCAMLADGVVLSSFIARPLQLHFSVLALRTGVAMRSNMLIDTALPSSSSTSSSLPLCPPAGAQDIVLGAKAGGVVPCLSSDTLAEVRDRVIAMDESSNTELAATIRGSDVFAVDRADWVARAGEVTSLTALFRMLKGFERLPDGSRLACLGIADGKGHLVFVPQRHLIVEVEVHIGGEPRTTRTLRIPATAHLRDLAKRLDRDLDDMQPADGPMADRGVCQWALATTVQAMAEEQATQESSAACCVEKSGASGGLPRKRKSIGCSSDVPKEKRRKSLSGAVLSNMAELCEDEFLGDLLAHHGPEPVEMPSQFLCPISLSVMRDPVVVVGSGNTYDRKSIERHLSRKKTDPLANTDLAKASDRALVPNNLLRSQISEAERAQVDLRLVALFGEPREVGSPLVAYLRWCGSLLRRSSSSSC